MKNPILILVFSIPVFLTCFAQQDSLKIKKYYHSWFIPQPEDIGRKKFISTPNKTIHGILFDVKDSSLLMTNYVSKEDLVRGNYKVSEIYVKNIQKMIYKPKGTMSIGKVAGGLTGLGVGLTVSIVAFPWEDTGYKFFNFLEVMISSMVTAGFTVAGVGIGSLIDHSTKTRIRVDGSQKNFELNKERIKQYSLKYHYKFLNDHPAGFSRLRDTIRDIDGNKYCTVALGGQVWMLGNLRVTHFCDGSETGKPGIVANGKELKYDWTCVNDKRALCPAGWHIPSKEEWNSMINSLGNFEQGMKMEKGFAPANIISHWWSSTEQDTVSALSVYLDNSTTGVMVAASEKTAMLSVRCIRDN